MSLHILVGRFGEFVGELAPAAAAEPSAEEPFPAAVVRIREKFGHHLVPLLLLARADGESVMAERVVIVRYCLDRARVAGMAVTFEEETALSDYVLDFEPSRIQLGPALKRLESESKDEIAALIAAAQAVIDADGERRAREVQFLEQLSRDLDAL